MSSLVQVYQTSLTSKEVHSFEPLIFFLYCLVLNSERATKIIFKAGVMEFLFQQYISGFPDPFSATEPHMFDKHLQLWAVCSSLLNICARTRYFVEDLLHVLWPQQQEIMSPQHISDRPTQRAQVWRTMESELVVMRIQAIFNRMVLEDYQHMFEQNLLTDIASDILEFSR